ncbi:hypothetical protein [Ralstonia syzygii]|uniref:hypothetical protein n=1 Tax=Ralstonia syzygii TaxID=28097 RepID=UPI0018CFF47C|nr:hypothetical protein [Ralstonia syzygii]
MGTLPVRPSHYNDFVSAAPVFAKKSRSTCGFCCVLAVTNRRPADLARVRHCERVNGSGSRAGIGFAASGSLRAPIWRFYVTASLLWQSPVPASTELGLRKALLHKSTLKSKPSL